MIECQKRTILWYMSFFGFAINTMIKINLNIAIVEMIGASNLNNTSSLNNEGERRIYFSLEKWLLGLNRHSLSKGNYFNWNEKEKAIVLASFYYLHWVMQIPGGILAKRYGTKIVFGLSNVVAAWMCVALPLAAYWSFYSLIILRLIQGFVNGGAWPSMHVMTARWIPPNDRSQFVTSYLGSSAGLVICYPLFGYTLSLAAWEWVFHMTAVIGTIWWMLWLYFIYDSPAKHPNISADEKEYIESALGDTLQEKSIPIPWKDILTSIRIWVSIAVLFGDLWCLTTMILQTPIYFSLIHKKDIVSTGFLSGLPHLNKTIFGYVFSLYGDYWLEKDKMSRTNVRKFATLIHCIVSGLFTVGLAFSGHNYVAAVTFVVLATTASGSISTGVLPGMVDMSPNFSGIIFGLSGTIALFAGFLSPMMVGYFTDKSQTAESWMKVFLVNAFLLFTVGGIYIIYGTTDVQIWNQTKYNQERSS